MRALRSRRRSSRDVRVLGAVAWALCLGSGCHRPAGRLTYETLQSAAEQRELRYGVYLPPAWDRTTPLPLVVLLHGRGDDETSADRTSLTSALDAGIRAGTIPPFVMATPEGEVGFWANWYDGSYRWKDWVLDEVIPDVAARYPVVATQAGLHLVGVSMGGGGGLQMWLGEPSRFASASILSAPIMNEADTRRLLRRFTSDRVVERVFGPPGSSAGHDPYVVLTQPEHLQGSRLLFGAATHDIPVMLASNRSFHRHLSEMSLPHRYLEFPGRHGWKAWSDAIPYALCVQLQETCSIPAPASWQVAVVERN